MSVLERKPAVATDPRFRGRVRDLLVELPNDVPGIGLRVTGDEYAVLVYPRAGWEPESFEDLLRLRWYSVEALRAPNGLEFQELKSEDVGDFLRDLQAARAS